MAGRPRCWATALPRAPRQTGLARCTISLRWPVSALRIARLGRPSRNRPYPGMGSEGTRPPGAAGGAPLAGTAGSRPRRDDERTVAAPDKMLGHPQDTVRNTIHIGPE